jgi:hypothetical protein
MKIWTPKLVATFLVLLGAAIVHQCAWPETSCCGAECACAHEGGHR